MKKISSAKTDVVKKASAVKKADATKKAKVSASKTKKATSKKKDDVEYATFEEKAFENDKKKKVIKNTKKTNMVPILAGVVCVVLVVGVVAYIRNNNTTLVETKKIEFTQSESTQAKSAIAESTKKIAEIKVEETTTTVNKVEGDISALKREMPCYDNDIYSEGALLAYDKNALVNIQKVISNIQNSSSYKDVIDEDKRDVLTVNKMMLDNYLDNYNLSYKNDYDATLKREYIDKIKNGSVEKIGKFYYSDYIAISLFAEAKDKGFYYEVPSSLYKKVTIKKFAFDKMQAGAKGSVSLPFGEGDALVPTEVIKVDDSTLSYKDKDGNDKMLKLVEKSDVEYALKSEETGSYIVAFYFNGNISVLKSARIGHGANMEYVAYNYLRYPESINFEVYVKAEDIVNKTSTNDMLNGQWINSSKQVWDEKGFVTSLVYFE